VSKAEITEQKCRVCNAILTSENAWISRSRSRFQSSCKVCSKEHANKWRSENKEKERLRSIQYYQENKAHLRPLYDAARIRRKYGLSTEELEAMQLAQGGLCAICHKSSKKKLCIDHSHATGQVRGLLCGKCNTLLGLASDSVELLTSAIEYLKKFQHK